MIRYERLFFDKLSVLLIISGMVIVLVYIINRCCRLSVNRWGSGRNLLMGLVMVLVIVDEEGMGWLGDWCIVCFLGLFLC